jgi:hypothetical protein
MKGTEWLSLAGGVIVTVYSVVHGFGIWAHAIKTGNVVWRAMSYNRDAHKPYYYAVLLFWLFLPSVLLCLTAVLTRERWAAL